MKLPASEADEAKLRAARELIHGAIQPKPMSRLWQLPTFTALVLGSYLFYFYYIEQPSYPPEPPAPKPLPAGAAKKLPDGRLLMADGSIHRAP